MAGGVPVLQRVQERAAWYSWSWAGTKPADNTTMTSELTSRATSRDDFLELVLLAIFYLAHTTSIK